MTTGVPARPVHWITGCPLCDTVVAVVATTTECFAAHGEVQVCADDAVPPDMIGHIAGALNERGHRHDGQCEVTSLTILLCDLLRPSRIPDGIRSAFEDGSGSDDSAST